MALNYQGLIKETGRLFSAALKEGYNSRRAGELSVKPLREQFTAGSVRVRDFDYGKLFTECFGWNEFNSCRSGDRLCHEVFEAAGAVSTAAFANISGQIMYTTVLDAYQNEEFVFTKLIPNKQTPYNGEKVPGISNIGNENLVVGEGQNYPLAGVSEDWIETPEPQKRGEIVALTREAIFFDRTGVLVERCSKVSESMGIDKEIRIVDCVIDENGGATSARTGHRYRWRGNSMATYNDNTGNHTWDNLAATNQLVDWTDLDNVEQLANAVTDPHTGQPIVLEPTHLIVAKELEQVAKRILTATEIKVTTPGYATSGNPTGTTMNNPYQGKYQLVTSRYLAFRMATDTSWFLLNPKAFAYMENWAIQTKQAPSNSHDEFHRDVVMQWRVDERGAPATVEPRLAFKSTVA